ncbi:MAG TPA: low affinity iron permease family protein [Puia sp.]|jgi:low affinity Fe/Cu permease|nr:low affinity iron permease family protein [Puia sp.]
MDSNKKKAYQVEDLASKIINAAGSTRIILTVFLLILLWAASGFYFHFSTKWASLIEIASSVITILMVFLIQKSQNKHSLSIQLKLNELVAANDKASNRLVNVEGMTENELKVIEKYYSKLSEFANKQQNLQQSHSIDEVHREHTIKKEMEDELSAVNKND